MNRVGGQGMLNCRLNGQANIGEIRELPGVTGVREANKRFFIYTSEMQPTLEALLAYAAQRGIPMTDLQVRTPTLKDVFLNLTSRELHPEYTRANTIHQSTFILKKTILARLQLLYDTRKPGRGPGTQLTGKQIVDGINSATTHQPGALTLDQQAVEAKGLREIDFITPGMLGILLMWANFAVGIQLVSWRELGITRRLAATPLKPISMISSQVVARLALSIVQTIILLALATWIFNVPIYGNLALLALVVVLGALTMLAIGFAVASFVKKTEAANSVILLVSFPMMFLGGSYFSTSGAPSFLQPVIHTLPLYYLNDALRQVIYSGASWGAIQTSMLVMMAWIVASMLLVWRACKCL